MRTLIIAEAGVNHNGSIEIAKQLIIAAKEANADFVKFQTFKTELAISKNAKKASYQIENTKEKDETQFEMVKKLELSVEDHHILVSFCKEVGIAFMSTPFDMESIDLLNQIGVEYGKIPSGEITNLPFLRKMAQSFNQLIVSTGMSSMEEIEEAINALINSGGSIENISILHCNTEYPTPMCDVNLLAMHHIQQKFGTKIGYSDHTMGIEVPIAAVALGAKIIEKHLTLDRSMDGPDHRASLEPQEFKAMVDAIRNIELAISGNGIKQASPSEIKNKEIARKSIVAKTFIPKGTILSEENIAVKRPGNGISPMKWDSVIGTFSIKDFQEDELIEI
jgi:N,N'-diacetyllegionaminate synthase